MVVLWLRRHCEALLARAVDIAVGCVCSDGRAGAKGLRVGRPEHHVWMVCDVVAS